MSQLDNAFTCHGQSWDNFCIVCEQEAYREYVQQMNDEYYEEEVDE